MVYQTAKLLLDFQASVSKGHACATGLLATFYYQFQASMFLQPPCWLSCPPTTLSWCTCICFMRSSYWPKALTCGGRTTRVFIAGTAVHIQLVWLRSGSSDPCVMSCHECEVLLLWCHVMQCDVSVNIVWCNLTWCMPATPLGSLLRDAWIHMHIFLLLLQVYWPSPC